MFLFGTVKLIYLLKCCIIVNCMYLILAQGTRRKAQGVFVLLTAHGASSHGGASPLTINYQL